MESRNIIKYPPYTDWNLLHAEILERLAELEKNSGILPWLFGIFGAIGKEVNVLDESFQKYLKTSHLLYETRLIFVTNIVESINEIRSYYIIKNDKQLDTLIFTLLTEMQFAKIMIMNKFSEIQERGVEIARCLHTFPEAEQDVILNNINNPKILSSAWAFAMKLPLTVNNIDAVQKLHHFIYDDTSFVISKKSYENFLDYIITNRIHKEAVIFKLLKKSLTISPKTISKVIEKSSPQLLIKILDCNKEYFPSIDDYVILIHNACRPGSNEIPGQKFRILCDKYPPTEAVLINALIYDNIIFANILMQEYRLNFPVELTDSDLQKIIYYCDIRNLNLMPLPMSKNILAEDFNVGKESRKFYKFLSSDKIQFCINHGASIENIDLDSKGVLGLPDLVKELVISGKDIKQQIDLGPTYTLLHLAASYGHPDTVKFLIISGLDVNGSEIPEFNLQGNPLHLAATYNTAEVVEILILEGADIDAVNGQIETALHQASYNAAYATGERQENAYNILELLMHYGANREIINKHEFFAYSYIPHKSEKERFDAAFEIQPKYEPLNSVEIEKNAKTLYCLSKNPASFFSCLPLELLANISSLMGNNRKKIECNTRASEYARSFFK